MQLSTPHRTSSLRSRLSAAACVLLASAAPTTAHAGPDATPAEADSDASWQLDGTALLYGERNRADIVEPIARAAGHRVERTQSAPAEQDSPRPR